MKRVRILFAITLVVVGLGTARAQVPGIINDQGRVTAGGASVPRAVVGRIASQRLAPPSQQREAGEPT